MTQGADLRAAAARDLLAFWEEAGVDVAEARAALARAARAGPIAPQPAPRPASPAGAAKPVAAARPAAPSVAAALAASCANRSELEAALAAFDAGQLKAAARRLVFAEGPDDAPVMVIGERPGAEEDREGRPFVGASGRLLDAMLGAIGLQRGLNVLISNVVFWRPPGDRSPTPGEVALCLPFCERLIAVTRPSVVLVAGGVAAQALLKRQDGPARLRGRRLELPGGGNAMVILHPAYLLRRPQEKQQAWSDLLALDVWLDELGVTRASRP